MLGPIPILVLVCLHLVMVPIKTPWAYKLPCMHVNLSYPPIVLDELFASTHLGWILVISSAW